ncbi:MAG TPA: YafY family protein [Bacillota bacterium]|nr:YafY family protein [Bacillota bacterium]HPL53474.1 YafY family protein [Bacillota bacterium]
MGDDRLKLDRLVSILVLLLRRERVQAKELADIFEVSVRTILRDVEAINLAGIPIVTYQGANGGISIAEGYRLDRSVLTEDDMSTIISTLRGIAGTMPDSKHEVLMEKLRNVLPSSQLAVLDAKVQQLIIDLSPWGAGKLLREITASIRRAIENHYEIEFKYIDSEGRRTNRRVEPYSLVLKGQKWYLYAWCHIRQDFRLFKLSRMRDLAVTESVFQPREASIEQLNWEDPWSKSEKQISLKLVFEKEMDSIVTEWFGEDAERQEDGKLLVNAVLPEGNWLYGFILSFGNGVEVLEPLHIRRIISDISKAIYEKYSLKT